jgi:hypothetical protein
MYFRSTLSTECYKAAWMHLIQQINTAELSNAAHAQATAFKACAIDMGQSGDRVKRWCLGLPLYTLIIEKFLVRSKRLGGSRVFR